MAGIAGGGVGVQVVTEGVSGIGLGVAAGHPDVPGQDESGAEVEGGAKGGGGAGGGVTELGVGLVPGCDENGFELLGSVLLGFIGQLVS